MPVANYDLRPSAVYRLFAETGQLLYVGCANDPKKRWQGLASKEGWWPYVADRSVNWYDTGAQGFAAELDAIRAESPLLNIASAAFCRPVGATWRSLKLPDGTKVLFYRSEPRKRWVAGYEEIGQCLSHIPVDAPWADGLERIGCGGETEILWKIADDARRHRLKNPPRPLTPEAAPWLYPLLL